MSGNKRLLLAGAIAALVLLAVPALALAAVWKDKGVNVTKFSEMTLAGGEIFEVSEGNGMNCKISATLTTEGGSTGKITKWTVTECPKGFGTFTSCTVKTAEAKGLPWTVTVNSSDLTITNLRVKRTFNGGCAESDKTIASTTVTLDSTTAITEMEFSGTNGTYKNVGSLTVTPSGTYGIG